MYDYLPALNWIDYESVENIGNLFESPERMASIRG